MFYTYLSKQWHKFPTEIWYELFMLDRYPSLSTGTLPSDLCIELVRPIYDTAKLREQTELESLISKSEEESSYYFACWQAIGSEYEAEYRAKEAELKDLRVQIASLRADDVLSNPDSAYTYLVNWHHSATLTEEEVQAQIIEWFKIIDEVSSDLADSYVGLLQSFFETNNLRYSVKRNRVALEIAFNPAFIASERFLTVKNKHCDNDHLRGLYKDFEHNTGELYAGCNSTKAKNVITASSNLLEGLANKATGKDGETLSTVLRTYLPNDSFPHLSAKEVLVRLYQFYCDYPGIRHGGTSTSPTRDLSERDAFLYGSLSVLFADYLSGCECPKCGANMTVKNGASGKLWGCERWPTCSGSKSVA